MCSLASDDENKVTIAREENMMPIAREGGVGALMTAMKQHVESADVQEFGCGALLKLACNDENKVTIARAGGVVVVTAVMQKLAHDSMAHDLPMKLLSKLQA